MQSSTWSNNSIPFNHYFQIQITWYAHTIRICMRSVIISNFPIFQFRNPILHGICQPTPIQSSIIQNTSLQFSLAIIWQCVCAYGWADVEKAETIVATGVGHLSVSDDSHAYPYFSVVAHSFVFTLRKTSDWIPSMNVTCNWMRRAHRTCAATCIYYIHFCMLFKSNI